jgi:hypothetical protein
LTRHAPFALDTPSGVCRLPPNFGIHRYSISGGSASMIADWFHCGNFLDDGNERTSTKWMISLFRNIASISSKSRVECPTV